MPNAALRPCAYPGCTELVQRGRCVKHETEHARIYRDREAQRLYGSKRWREMRVVHLAREPWCADCLKRNIYTQATDVDHVVPHRNDALAFFTGQLQSLCHECHSRKTANEVFHQGEGASKSSNRGRSERRGPSA